MKQIHQLVEAGDVVRPDWNGYNVLHDAASRVAALDIGFLPSASAQEAPPPKAVYLLGADDYEEADVPADAFVIYQGHHGDRGAIRADVVLPGGAYTEKSGTYVNFEGRTQITRRAVPVPGDARDDWKIVRATSEILGKPLPYNTLEAVRGRLADVAPHLGQHDTVQHPLWLNGEYFKAFASGAQQQAEADAAPFATSIDNYYQTDAISRASSTMAKCTLAKANSAHAAQ
jgi:NADH dehydrogenase (ubiquinone) Fe-S protein 1